jgi:hypothetical protein
LMAIRANAAGNYLFLFFTRGGRSREGGYANLARCVIGGGARSSSLSHLWWLFPETRIWILLARRCARFTGRWPTRTNPRHRWPSGFITSRADGKKFGLSDIVKLTARAAPSRAFRAGRLGIHTMAGRRKKRKKEEKRAEAEGRGQSQGEVRIRGQKSGASEIGCKQEWNRKNDSIVLSDLELLGG